MKTKIFYLAGSDISLSRLEKDVFYNRPYNSSFLFNNFDVETVVIGQGKNGLIEVELPIDKTKVTQGLQNILKEKVISNLNSDITSPINIVVACHGFKNIKNYLTVGIIRHSDNDLEPYDISANKFLKIIAQAIGSYQTNIFFLSCESYGLHSLKNIPKQVSTIITISDDTLPAESNNLFHNDFHKLASSLQTNNCNENVFLNFLKIYQLLHRGCNATKITFNNKSLDRDDLTKIINHPNFKEYFEKFKQSTLATSNIEDKQLTSWFESMITNDPNTLKLKSCIELLHDKNITVEKLQIEANKSFVQVDVKQVFSNNIILQEFVSKLVQYAHQNPTLHKYFSINNFKFLIAIKEAIDENLEFELPDLMIGKPFIDNLNIEDLIFTIGIDMIRNNEDIAHDYPLEHCNIENLCFNENELVNFAGDL